MKWDWTSAGVLLVALCVRARDKWSNWTLGLSFGGFPMQTVMLTSVADDFLSELTCALAIARFACVLRLRVREIFENVEREQFVSTYSSVQ